jgi:hypothetical protein
MFNPNGHFWYSRKLNKLKQKMADECKYANFCIIKGKTMEYNLWSQTDKHNSGWDDIEYLGYGKYSHSE